MACLMPLPRSSAQQSVNLFLLETCPIQKPRRPNWTTAPTWPGPPLPALPPGPASYETSRGPPRVDSTAISPPFPTLGFPQVLAFQLFQVLVDVGPGPKALSMLLTGHTRLDALYAVCFFTVCPCALLERKRTRLNTSNTEKNRKPTYA